MGLLADSMTIFKREMIIFRANLRTNIIRSIMFPIILIAVFGNLGASIRGVPIAVANYANNQQSVQFINSLVADGSISLQYTTNQQQGVTLLKDGQVVGLVVILPTFPQSSNGNPPVDVYYSSVQLSEVGVLLSKVQTTASSFGASYEKIQQGSQSPSGPSGVISGSAGSLTVKSNSAYGTGGNYTTFLVGSIIFMTVGFGGVFGSGMSFITDRQLGNIKAFLVSPINKRAIVLGKLFSGTVQSVIYGILSLIIGIAFGAKIIMGLAGLVWILLFILAIGLAFTGLSLFLASRMSKVDVFAIVSQFIVMPLWFLSGAFFPANDFPFALRIISYADPLTYVTNGVRAVMLTTYFPFSQIILDFGVAIAFIIVALIASFVLFKDTLD